MKDINPLIEEILSGLTNLRREFHQYPELGYEEEQTAERIVRWLSKLPGLRIERGIAKTGVVATLDADKSGPCVALRSDMDALPIAEETGKPYTSKIPGKMHACGHDGHMACLLGAATVLSQIREELPGPVKFIFQPAEEGGGGGRQMCEEGVLKNPEVKAIFGLHGMPTLKLGTAGLRAGSMMASQDSFNITVIGKGGHAAWPHTAIDPVLIGSHIITALQSIVSRSTDPLEATVVSVPMFHAGAIENVIPEKAELCGTLRALSDENRQRLHRQVEQIATSVAAAYGGRAEVKITPGYPVLVNDEKSTVFANGVAHSVFKQSAVDGKFPPMMGAEDFAYYLEKVPGAFWFLGVCPPTQENYPFLHNPKYDFNDDAISLGIRMHCEIARQFFRSYGV